MKLSFLAKQELQRLRDEEPRTYFALHNHERTRERRDWRWEALTRGWPPDLPESPAPPGDGPLERAVEREQEERVARFKQENEGLLKRYEETPPERKRERRELAREILRRLLGTDLITGEQFIGLCAFGPRARKWWGPIAQIARATA